MAISLIEDIKTVSEFKKDLRAVLQQVRDTGRPVVVTVNGRPQAVVVDVETFERKLAALNMTALLMQGEEDIRRGRTRSASGFLKDFRRAKKVPR